MPRERTPYLFTAYATSKKRNIHTKQYGLHAFFIFCSFLIHSSLICFMLTLYKWDINSKKKKIQSEKWHTAPHSRNYFLHFVISVSAISLNVSLPKDSPKLCAGSESTGSLWTGPNPSINSTSWTSRGLLLRVWLSVDRVALFITRFTITSIVTRQCKVNIQSLSTLIKLSSKTQENAVIVAWVAHYLTPKLHICSPSHGTIFKKSAFWLHMLNLWTKYMTGKCTKCQKRGCKSPENIVYNHNNGRVHSRHVSDCRWSAIWQWTGLKGDPGPSGLTHVAPHHIQPRLSGACSATLTVLRVKYGWRSPQ